MILPFEHIENIDNAQFNDDNSNFSLTVNTSPKLKLLRGIVGSIRLKHTISQIEFNQTVDYLDLQGANVTKGPLERIKDYISEDISIKDLDEVFGNRSFRLQNLTFFERLNQEYNNFYYYEYKNSHTTAFAFLYRILETISYAFPSIYASKSDDFKGTYTLLKEYISGNRDKGELGFFKSFVKLVFNPDPAIVSSITIDIFGHTDEIKQKFFDSLLKASPNRNMYDATDTLEPIRLSVKFTDYSSFIINLRNRFFHLFNSGQPNLESDDVLDADSFFSQINKKSMYWISFILLEILKHNVAREMAR